jgi:ribosomal protein S18 acetylase RimI-like enzyme
MSNRLFKFEPVTTSDLLEIKKLQPSDWSDIIPDISYYINSDFCYPVKVKTDSHLAGIGAAIIYGRTAWLAHIIVRDEFRKRGIGSGIVEELLKITSRFQVKSILLTATHLGKGVYEKAGFRSISSYTFMNREERWKEQQVSSKIVNYKEAYRNGIYDLDRLVSGEDRTRLLDDFITGANVFLENGIVKGYCIPALKEGPIIAENHEAGLELMKVKYKTSDKAVVPEENRIAFGFLKSAGFKETETKGTRMVLGEDIPWQPLKIYSRAGGNFG